MPPVKAATCSCFLLAGLSAAQRHGFAAVREGYYVLRLDDGRTGLGRASWDCGADSDQRECGKQHFGYTSHGGGLLDADFPRWRESICPNVCACLWKMKNLRLEGSESRVLRAIVSDLRVLRLSDIVRGGQRIPPGAVARASE